jgi:hypothetical protein
MFPLLPKNSEVVIRTSLRGRPIYAGDIVALLPARKGDAPPASEPILRRVRAVPGDELESGDPSVPGFALPEGQYWVSTERPLDRDVDEDEENVEDSARSDRKQHEGRRPESGRDDGAGETSDDVAPPASAFANRDSRDFGPVLVSVPRPGDAALADSQLRHWIDLYGDDTEGPFYVVGRAQFRVELLDPEEQAKFGRHLSEPPPAANEGTVARGGTRLLQGSEEGMADDHVYAQTAMDVWRFKIRAGL